MTPTRLFTAPTSILLVTHASRWNLWMDPINAEPPQVIKSFHIPPPSPPQGEDFTALASDDASDLTDNNSHCMSIICANDLVDLMFLMDPREDGQCQHDCIVEFINIMSMTSNYQMTTTSLASLSMMINMRRTLYTTNSWISSKRTRRMKTLSGNSSI
jgi:hypothetical protein